LRPSTKEADDDGVSVSSLSDSKEGSPRGGEQTSPTKVNASEERGSWRARRESTCGNKAMLCCREGTFSNSDQTKNSITFTKIRGSETRKRRHNLKRRKKVSAYQFWGAAPMRRGPPPLHPLIQHCRRTKRKGRNIETPSHQSKRDNLVNPKRTKKNHGENTYYLEPEDRKIRTK